MSMLTLRRAFIRVLPATLAIVMYFGLQPVHGGSTPDPAVMSYKLPDQIQWKGSPDGPQNATLYGDPNKPGLYIVLTKWTPHHMSRPHFHPNDRFIHVVSGTWWVGWGPKYDPDSTFPIPAGSFVQHYGKQIHYDGAKDGEAVLEIVGMGPATSTSAEQK